jgi:uncharacterized membrane protein
MKQNSDILSFDWIVRISPVALLLLMIPLPILFFIWLFKAGQLSERRLSLKPDYLFRILMTTFALGFALIILFMIVGENSYLDFDKYIIYAFLTLFISFLYCDFYVTNLTFKHEDEDEYNSNMLEKVRTFIILSSLILGAVLLQPRLNEIFSRQRKPYP